MEIPLLRVTTPPLTTWDALLPDQAKRPPTNSPKSTPTSTTSASSPPDTPTSPPSWAALSPNPDPAAPAVVEAPLPARLRDAAPRGRRLDLLAQVARIPLDQPVPHPTTLSKLVRRAGPGVIDQLNTALVGKLAADKLLRGRKLRVDTTVVGANVAYPTDLGLLARAVASWSPPPSGCRLPGAHPGPGCGTVGAWRGAGPARSRGRCGRAAVTPSRSCSR
jgi:hypothetical protein